MESDKLRDGSLPKMEWLGFWEFDVEDMVEDVNKRPMKRWREDCKSETPKILMNVEVIIRSKVSCKLRFKFQIEDSIGC